MGVMGDKITRHGCKMLCVRGSEMGACPCARPSDCKLQSHPMYGAWRDEAEARMWQFFFAKKGGGE